jgi:signal transduction histidine kinase
VKKQKKSNKTIFRIAMPVILAAAILWAVVMCQLTMITAERMVGEIPEQMEWFVDDSRLIVWNSPNFTHGDPTTLPDRVLVQELGHYLYTWWGFYTPFPDYTRPFLLDPSGFDWLPAELRYGYHLGMGLFTEDGVPLFTTCNLMQFDFRSHEFKDTMVLKDDPLTVDGVEYRNIGEYLAQRIRPGTFRDEEPGFEYYRDWCDDYYFYNHDFSSIFSYNAIHVKLMNGMNDLKIGYAAIVMCEPMAYCALRLIPFYVVSALFVALLVWLYLGWIRRRLLVPMEEVIASLKKDTQQYGGADLDIEKYRQTTGTKDWHEPVAMCAHLHLLRQELAQRQTEITRLNTALDYAEHAEEYRKQLISNITHELKTPLAVVHSYTEGLQSEIAPEKKERYLQVILDEAERMDGMVMQMLELSRLEAGRVKLKMEYFDLGAVIRDVAERFEPLMAEKELKLRLELDGQQQMNGDEGRIEQVITNFMSNAVKYSTPGGEILVKAVFGKLGLYFSITNNAKHLSEEGLQKVFDSFYREDAARTEKSTGLGLAIVKNIMNLHGFQCYVNNTMLNDQPAVEFGFRRE